MTERVHLLWEHFIRAINSFGFIKVQDKPYSIYCANTQCGPINTAPPHCSSLIMQSQNQIVQNLCTYFLEKKLTE